jgi:hypothetical protein
MKMEQTECSKTMAHKIQTPGNYPEESIQHATTVSSRVTSPTNDKLTTGGRKTSVNVTYNKTNTPTVNSVGTNTPTVNTVGTNTPTVNSVDTNT